MKELHEIVTAKVKTMIDDGSIENMIGKRIYDTICECVKEAFQSYGNFGKSIKEKIETAIQCAGRDIEFPAYNLFVKEVAERTFIKVLDENAVAHLAEIIEEVISPVEKNAKVSDLLSEIEEACGDDARENGIEEIVIESEMSDSDEALYVKIKIDSTIIKVSFYNFKHNNNDTWHIGYINEDGVKMTGRSTNIARYAYHKISDILFKYYAMQTEFELDTEFESINLRDY